LPNHGVALTLLYTMPPAYHFRDDLGISNLSTIAAVWAEAYEFSLALEKAI